MKDLLKEASRALCENDADTLERLARKARELKHNPLGMNLAEVARAAEVLSAQVNAAFLHLELISRSQAKITSTYKANPWER